MESSSLEERRWRGNSINAAQENPTKLNDLCEEVLVMLSVVGSGKRQKVGRPIIKPL